MLWSRKSTNVSEWVRAARPDREHAGARPLSNIKSPVCGNPLFGIAKATMGGGVYSHGSQTPSALRHARRARANVSSDGISDVSISISYILESL